MIWPDFMLLPLWVKYGWAAVDMDMNVDVVDVVDVATDPDLDKRRWREGVFAYDP